MRHPRYGKLVGMWSALVSWLTVAIVVPVLIGIGVGVMSMTPPEFRLAKACFTFAAILLLLRAGWWVALVGGSASSRAIFCFLVFGLAGLLWVESIHWVERRRLAYIEGRKLTQSSAPVTRTPATDVERFNRERLRVEQEQLALNYLPSVAVIYQDKRVNIFNQGRTNLYLWGATYGDLPVTVDKEPRVIAPGICYYLFAENIEKQMLDHLQNNQEGFTTFHVFVTTQDSKRHTIKGRFLGKISGGTVAIHTQAIGTLDGWVNK